MTTCTVPDCDKPIQARGYCNTHYTRWHKHGDPLVVMRRGPRPQNKVCTFPDCDGPSRARGYCTTHYNRWKRFGTAAAAVRALAPNGAGTINSDGYRRITVNGRRINEHRVVMEAALGRPLWPDENVHHKNGDRADNRLENLELWSSVQPAGQRIPDKVEYALEILSRYAPHLLPGVNVA